MMLHDWIDVPDLKTGDRVVIGGCKVVIDWASKLPTGDYQVFWTRTRTDGEVSYGAATFLKVTSLQAW